jgi:hypothetical protein
VDPRERPFAALLIGVLVEWTHGLGLPDWAREAVTHSLESGHLAQKVHQALAEARERGRRDDERPTPVQDQERPTLPTEPPVDYSDPPRTGRTSKGFPRV